MLTPAVAGLRGSDGGLPAVTGAEEEPAHRHALQRPHLLPQRHAQSKAAFYLFFPLKRETNCLCFDSLKEEVNVRLKKQNKPFCSAKAPFDVVFCSLQTHSVWSVIFTLPFMLFISCHFVLVEVFWMEQEVCVSSCCSGLKQSASGCTGTEMCESMKKQTSHKEWKGEVERR